MTQYEKRKEREGIAEKTSDARKGIVATEFFDWSEYPDNVII